MVLFLCGIPGGITSLLRKSAVLRLLPQSAWTARYSTVHPDCLPSHSRPLRVRFPSIISQTNRALHSEGSACLWYPRWESNPQLRFRRALVYPFTYGDVFYFALIRIPRYCESIKGIIVPDYAKTRLRDLFIGRHLSVMPPIIQS